mmetsp:Transcript_3101/g.1819  ORF Transcript_3101/g.1819 Transcript_3101/m.1819 type:complete len:95 (+) Transcript_3101:6286-6570(+)
MTLTKRDLVNEIYELGYSQKRAVELVEILLEIIKNSLEQGNYVLISGFGKFCVKHKKERKGRNPSTGNNLILRKRKVVTFICSGILRNRINKRR